MGVTEQRHIVGIPIEADGSAGEPFVHLELPGVAIDGIGITDDGDFVVADPPANTIWLIGDDGPVSAGVFQPDADGGALVLLDGAVRPGLVLGLTIEPAGGSVAPTGDILIAQEV